MKLTLPEDQASFIVLSSDLSTVYNTEQLNAFGWLLEASFLKLICFMGLMCMHAKSFQLCTTLCGPMDCSPPGSSVHGILQARILEWAAMPSSRGSSWPRVGTHVCYVSCIDMWVLYHWATCVCSVAKPCPTLCDPVDCSLPGSSAHGIF